MWDDMFGFSQWLNGSFLRGMDSRHSPCHQGLERGVTLASVNYLYIVPVFQTKKAVPALPLLLSSHARLMPVE